MCLAIADHKVHFNTTQLTRVKLFKVYVLLLIKENITLQ